MGRSGEGEKSITFMTIYVGIYRIRMKFFFLFLVFGNGRCVNIISVFEYELIPVDSQRL